MAKLLENFEGFEWDEGNAKKNWHLHRVLDRECEEVFFNVPIIIIFDKSRKSDEVRHIALGRTDADRRLFIAFTVRNKLIRVISARDMTKGDERKYEEKAKRTPDI